ncbi:helix-turn-helix domain-containing protein [Vibrio lentus]|uniref:helix-turn-helix domain-containing protein n=1 Tax=Vibrio lentus TaxID=136468 RepID=UPI0010BDAF9C|nr:helix-turn-helix domain-containing protein [Vibrio lentus]TKG17756.1 helix-turn-helix domain-containing protein [Vibrio lentus]
MQHPHNGNQYLTIPFSLLKELDSNQAILYSIMKDQYMYCIGKYGVYNPSDKKLSEFAGFSVDTVKRARGVLEDKGYIRAVSRRERCATIWHVNDLKPNSHEPLNISPVMTDRIKALLASKVEKDEPDLSIGSYLEEFKIPEIDEYIDPDNPPF